jgi:hypothetical protein
MGGRLNSQTNFGRRLHNFMILTVETVLGLFRNFDWTAIFCKVGLKPAPQVPSVGKVEKSFAVYIDQYGK